MARTTAPTPEQLAEEFVDTIRWPHDERTTITATDLTDMISAAIRADRARLGADIEGERVPTSSGYEYNGHGIRAARRQGASTGSITTTGRTSAALRQEVANRMATATETAELTRETGAGVYATYRVRFITTHRIIPIRHFGLDAE